ncbi:MAG: 5-methyltetrahydropteroyltriglutamate--homocysteine S-methyltransferase [Anaerolineae bacterium]|nr:5-methyltetrahydropteroyltriglutamate--homocysteine S-methyltransferase [Anaerolineae bacterium]
MPTAVNLGYPRIGPNREFKRAVEAYWRGKISQQELLDTCADIRHDNWLAQRQAGIVHIPSNDFSLYDHVLDTTAMVGAVPPRYGWRSDTVDLDTYFAMARGVQTAGLDVPAMEMTKWFDTNYHYLVPEFWPGMQFKLASDKPVAQFEEARDLGVHTRPVLLGPITFLTLGKSTDGALDPLALLDGLLVVYVQVLQQLADAGADRVQIDEPALALDLPPSTLKTFETAYAALSTADGRLKLHLTTYFGTLGDNLNTALSLPVSALHLDLVRAPEQLAPALAVAPPTLSLSLGVVDGRNVWRTDLARAQALIAQAVDVLGTERVLIGPSCSLIHSPVDLNAENEIDAEVKPWLAFARQKLDEIALLARLADGGVEAIRSQFEQNQAAIAARRASTKTHAPQVRARMAQITPQMAQRATPYAGRKKAQQAYLHLPPLPTTTIGSFPQTGEVRRARSDWLKGRLSTQEYEDFLRQEIERTVRYQEEIGLDVLVHGEFERTDMVEYFGQQMDGFLFTQNGWVQSYGSRCVRPPIIYGDVQRPQPMTVRWSRYAQSLTPKPMKGMLTGPVTILKWSFVRDDQPRADTCRQIALALRDEVLDLEAAGIKVIQIDEPALREGMPLRRADWDAYLGWAVECFRLTAGGVRDETQIHTHMCYSEFNEIIEWVGTMDADVISIESSRSRMDLLGAFVDYRYPNDIGPGVYDIHSPRIPATEELVELLRKALQVLSPEQVWVNPDCGLKTRGWAEVKPSLERMVEAAQTVRQGL